MHRINRVEIELRAGDVPAGRDVSERVSRMQGRLAPILDRVCGELSGSGTLDRLDRLEVELGAIPEEGFEEAFVARLEPALRAALAAALRRRGGRGDRPARDALELLETFALIGGLPWWADARDGEVVARHFARAAADAPDDVVALVRRLANDSAALERLGRACDGEALVALAGRAGVGGAGPPGRIDVAGRRALLSALAGRDAGRGATALEPGGERAGRRPARREAASVEAEAVQTAAIEAAAGEATASEGAAGDAVVSEAAMGQAAAGAAVAGAVAEEAAAGEGSAGEATAPERIDKGQESMAPRQALDPRPEPGAEAPPPIEHQAPRVEVAQERLPAAPHEAGEPPRARQPWASRMAPAAGETSAPRPSPTVPRPAMAAPRPSVPPPSEIQAAVRAARRAVLARLDELYVDDAGLVILWPFLERFFVRVGLVGEDRRFLDEPSAFQAVALLAAIGAGDLDPPEFRLPLAKLLCGLPLESRFQLDRPLMPEQLAEGDRLLAAAIDRAQVLGELPIPGFRATFLQRRGALSTRDGAWLLQVERQAQDALLDRFPWSWGWVKLPWMPDPLRVEW